MPPSETLTDKVQWNDKDILLIGTTHGAQTLHEDIVNELEDFNPSIVLTEGNSVGNEAVEHRSVRNYNAISGTKIKPLKTLPFEPDGYTSHQNINEDDTTQRGSIDERNAGERDTRLIRSYFKIKNEEKYEKYVEKRDDQMAMKIIYEIDHNNHDRVAVIFGRLHVIGVKKILQKEYV